jgi:hypothetical protein
MSTCCCSLPVECCRNCPNNRVYYSDNIYTIPSWQPSDLEKLLKEWREILDKYYPERVGG